MTDIGADGRIVSDWRKYHLKEIYDDVELQPEATIRNYRIVRAEGRREVDRQIDHYNLQVILAVGYRVRSHRGVQFRQWATERLTEYLVKGFAMDDERLKNPPGKGYTDYFDELLARIRNIRSSERRFYQKILDIYATRVDYNPDAETGACRIYIHHESRKGQGPRRCLIILSPRINIFTKHTKVQRGLRPQPKMFNHRYLWHKFSLI